MDWIEVKRDKDNDLIVKCTAEIRDNQTGEVREYETNEVIREGDKYPSVFNWEENNYSCDCNRRLFFKYASNEEVTEEDFDNIECSDGKFSVNLKNKKDGKIYYREFN